MNRLALGRSARAQLAKKLESATKRAEFIKRLSTAVSIWREMALHKIDTDTRTGARQLVLLL